VKLIKNFLFAKNYFSVIIGIMTKQELKKGQIVIYKTSKNEVGLEVKFDGESVWLRQNQIAELFKKDRTVVTRHINNIFKDKEMDKKSSGDLYGQPL